jgi:hypothetical protein
MFGPQGLVTMWCGAPMLSAEALSRRVHAAVPEGTVPKDLDVNDMKQVKGDVTYIAGDRYVESKSVVLFTVA